MRTSATLRSAAVSAFRHITLGGGGSKGVGHLGVLKVLEEHLRVDSYAGTSAGALVGFNKALGVSSELLAHFMGVPSKDSEVKRVMSGVRSTDLQLIVKRSREPKYFPTGMPDLALTMMTYGVFGGDPLHLSDAQGMDHPIVLEEKRFLKRYRESIKKRKRDLEREIGREQTRLVLDTLEDIETITFGQWCDFLAGLDREVLDLTRLTHFSCAVTKVTDSELTPMTLTSLPGTVFSEQSREIPMILGMAASASFPWALPPVIIDDRGTTCIDGGIFQNVLYTKKLFADALTMAVNLGHKPVQAAWDNGMFYNFGKLKQLGLGYMMKKELVVPDAYIDCVYGFPIDRDLCLVGLNEHALAREAEVIRTLTPSPTPEQSKAFLEGSAAFIRKALEMEKLLGGSIVLDFDKTDYGVFLRKVREEDE